MLPKDVYWLLASPHKPTQNAHLVKPRKLNAESPSKNCVSGMVPPIDSRLNQPLLDILEQRNYRKQEAGKVGVEGKDVGRVSACALCAATVETRASFATTTILPETNLMIPLICCAWHGRPGTPGVDVFKLTL